MTDDNTQFSFDFGSGTRFDLDAIRARRSAFMPDNGQRLGVISTVFALDDPEQSMDRMSLDVENFVGVTAIHCLLCSVRYQSAIRFHKCPQTQQESI